MLSKATALEGYTLVSPDGDVGRVKEFYFDDQQCAIRYLVAGTGAWRSEKKVLIPPRALGPLFPEKRHIAVELTAQQIENSPSASCGVPMSQPTGETRLPDPGSPRYWGGPHMWGSPPDSGRERDPWRSPIRGERAWRMHLGSTRDVSGYQAQAVNGDSGCVEDVVIDDETWAIRYWIIDTGNRWAGRTVLLDAHWVERVSWSESTVYLKLARETVRNLPEYTEAALLALEYETRLRRHYDP
ncbi:MAG: PRC-barrel domain-containing protein [Candidatus Eisenbacteria bacterium]|nr:PRC-barrel domain-containing protein [Candidatus Eisenbacteria bacterium]